MNLGIYAKAINGALLTAAATLVVCLFGTVEAPGDGLITATEWWIVAGQFVATLALVWAVPFDALGRYAKPIATAVTGFVGSMAAASASDGIQQAEWQAALGILLLAVIAVVNTSNAPATVVIETTAREV